MVVLGFFFALLGILTSIFPMIENEHFQVILNSFQETSVDPLTNTLNTIVLFCLRSSYFFAAVRYYPDGRGRPDQFLGAQKTEDRSSRIRFAARFSPRG